MVGIQYSNAPWQGPDFILVGNSLAIDFANAEGGSGRGRSIGNWFDLIDFLGAVGIVTRSQTELLRNLPMESPQIAEAAFRISKKLQQGICQLLEAIAEGRAVAAEAVIPINDVLRFSEGHDHLERDERGGWRMGFRVREQRLEWLLAGMARSAAELVLNESKGRIRRCANPACGLYFRDVSKSGTRRWCEMSVCGNRRKVAAFAKRRQAWP